jgi:hypothetical protein
VATPANRDEAARSKPGAALADPLPFPHELPSGYEAMAEEPSFDPDRHLALTAPAKCWTLAAFGYDRAAINGSPSAVGVAGPFRVLSDEGVRAAEHVARQLKKFSRRSGRTANYLAGGAYRSRFLRDLFGSARLVDFLSEVAETALAPHAMPSQRLYINYAPDDIARHVDSWHTDSIGFDIVLMVTDPAAIKGGEFQFFRGTREAAAGLLATQADGLIEGSNIELPATRVETVRFPGPGHALFQQGNFVLHRATRLLERSERITMVPGYVARETGFDDPTNVGSIVTWGEPGLAAELARHKAWLARGRLSALIENLPIDAPPDQAAAALRRAVADVRDMADLLDPAGMGDEANFGTGIQEG